MLHAIFDPFSGISGDMILGCWIDLGLDRDWLLEVVDRLELPLEDVLVQRVDRAGLEAVKVTVVTEEGSEHPPGGFPSGAGGHGHAAGGHGPGPGGHGHGAGGSGPPVRGHGHGSGGHGRSIGEIRRTIEASRLDERPKALALAAFARLAAAEGRVHGVPPDEVHFHELGAVDAIVDVCGAADGFVRLGIGDASTTPVALGAGTVEIRHGRYPVPAPATAYLLEGTTVRPGGYRYETVTPTGAALLAEFCRGRSAEGDARVRRIGYGAGSLDPEDHPNCLRVWLTERDGDLGSPVLVLQTDVDDMTPEYVPRLLEACLEAGALDAVVHGVQMKKGRPGWRLEVQVEAEHREAVEEAVFRHSTTLGVRSWPVQRRVLERWIECRQWRGHPIRVKVHRLPPGEGEGRGKAEHDDVVAAAAAEGMDPARVMRELRRVWPDLW